eukprot:GDKI01049566.1.p1 GENE.GDKI01049566.1~~GDKI01049566.1.p1  ORF type:complete len:282 (-),score=109.42 GDKI01049566.1:43-888(-)
MSDPRDDKKRKAEAEEREEREKKEKKMRRDSSSSESSSDSSSSSSSSSDSDSSVSSREERKRKKEKKEKKEKRVKKEKKKEKKRKEEKDKKKKKDAKKKDKKKDKRKKKDKKDPSKTGAVTEQYGKYGLIEETDMWRVRPEFGLWLLEVKGTNIEHLTPFDEKQAFREFMEDYNTATLPHRKFYGLEAYETERQMKASQKQAPTKAAPLSFDDSRSRQEEINRIREQRKQEALIEARKNLDEEKIASMRRQKELKHQMETLFKMGRIAEAEKIQRLLLPEE